MKRIHPLATVHPTDVADRNALATALGQYRELWQPRASPDGADGDRSHTALVSRFYDVVTPFYEYAWGTSFHFSPRHPGERLTQAQRRHEEGVGRLLGLRSGMRVADIGCYRVPMTTSMRPTPSKRSATHRTPAGCFARSSGCCAPVARSRPLPCRSKWMPWRRPDSRCSTVSIRRPPAIRAPRGTCRFRDATSCSRRSNSASSHPAF